MRLFSLIPYYISLLCGPFRKHAHFDIPCGDEPQELLLDPRSFDPKLDLDFLGFDNASDLAEWNPIELSFVSDLDAFMSSLPFTTKADSISIPGNKNECLLFANEPNTSSNAELNTNDADFYFKLLEALKNLPCLTYTDAYYTYEYCHLRKIKQIPSGPKSLDYGLGHYFPKNPRSTQFKFLGRAFVINYFSGDKCTPFYPSADRETEVRFVCGKKKTTTYAEIISVFEVSVCKYVITIASNLVCPLRSPEIAQLESQVRPYRLVCGNVDLQADSFHGPFMPDKVKARSLWLKKLASLLSAHNPHSILARALLDMADFDSLDRSDFNVPDMLDVFAIKSLQQRIAKAIGEISGLDSRTTRDRKRRIFITTFDNTEESSMGGQKKDRKGRKKTYKIEL
jgi:hypothetical protein